MFLARTENINHIVTQFYYLQGVVCRCGNFFDGNEHDIQSLARSAAVKNMVTIYHVFRSI